MAGPLGPVGPPRGRGRSPELRFPAVGAEPFPSAPCGHRGVVAALRGPAWPPWARCRSFGTSLATVEAWQVPCTLCGCCGEMSGPLVLVWPPWRRGRSFEPHLAFWACLAALEAWLALGPHLAAVWVWPVNWAPPGYHGNVVGFLGPVWPASGCGRSPRYRLVVVGA